MIYLLTDNTDNIWWKVSAVSVAVVKCYQAPGAVSR